MRSTNEMISIETKENKYRKRIVFYQVGKMRYPQSNLTSNINLFGGDTVAKEIILVVQLANLNSQSLSPIFV